MHLDYFKLNSWHILGVLIQLVCFTVPILAPDLACTLQWMYLFMLFVCSSCQSGPKGSFPKPNQFCWLHLNKCIWKLFLLQLNLNLTQTFILPDWFPIAFPLESLSSRRFAFKALESNFFYLGCAAHAGCTSWWQSTSQTAAAKG